MKDAQKGVRMTDDEESGHIEFKPAPSQQVLRPTDAGLTNVDRLAESIAREMGYNGAAYALEVVSIQDWVYDQAKQGNLRLYREDKPFPFVAGALFEFHGGLRLSGPDAQKVRTEFLGEVSAPLQPPAEQVNSLAPVVHVPMLKQPGRRDLLAPVIAEAQRKCPNPFDAQAVFLALRSMAEAKVPPMYGVAPEGIQWRDANDDAQTLSQKNLGDRLRRLSQKKTPSSST
jgi:hypothetical protein